MRRLTRPRIQRVWEYAVAGVVVTLWMAAMWCLAVLGHGWGLNG